MPKKNAWDTACKLTLHRRDPDGRGLVPLEPGVNYFVLALERMGARTRYSCEGHPSGFYVMFHSSAKVARQVSELVYPMEVKICPTWSDAYVLRLAHIPHPATDDYRVTWLRLMAKKIEAFAE